MPIYFGGPTRSTLFTHIKNTRTQNIQPFSQIMQPQLTDIEIGYYCLLLWQSKRLLISMEPRKLSGKTVMAVQLPNPAANEYCKLVAPHNEDKKIFILTTNNVFWEYHINKKNWKQISIFTPKSSEHAVKIIHCGYNLLLTNLGRLLTMHDHREIGSDVKFIEMAYGGEDVILLGDDGKVYVILIEDGMFMDDAYVVRLSLNGCREPIEMSGPHLVPFEAKIVQIAAGTVHYAAITDQGHLYTWGKNGYGELGLGFCNGFQNIPRLVSFQNDDININIKVKKVGCGNSFTICLTDDGTLWGAGKNVYYREGEDFARREMIGKFAKLNMASLCGETVKDLKCNEWSTAIITE